MQLPTLMTLHIAAGTIAVLSGAATIFAAKGAPTHRRAGQIFFAAMLTASAAGAYVAFHTAGQFIAFLGGVLAFYLVLTGWLTVMRPEKRFGSPETFAWAFVAATGAALLGLGIDAATSATGLSHGYPAEPYFFLSAVSLLAAALDASVYLRAGVAGRHRIARHLWRMSFGFFIAAGSLFTGPGAKAFPEILRQSGVLSAPEGIIILLMGFWLVRVLFTRRFDRP